MYIETTLNMDMELFAELTRASEVLGKSRTEIIVELLKIDPDVKAVVCTGHSNDPVMTDFQKYGFKGAMPKPYEKKHLEETLEKLLVE